MFSPETPTRGQDSENKDLMDQNKLMNAFKTHTSMSETTKRKSKLKLNDKIRSEVERFRASKEYFTAQKQQLKYGRTGGKPYNHDIESI